MTPNQRVSRPSTQRTIDNPTCSFTGERLVGTIAIRNGGSNGVDHEEVPMAAAEFHRRRNADDESVPHAPGMSVQPLYRASLPDDEIETAQELRHTKRDELSSDDWKALYRLIGNGWTVEWFPVDPYTDEYWCDPYKPFDNPA